MTETRTYQAIIVGAGQAGVPLSAALSEAGWKVALVEREHEGGTCINTGCTPTKTMAASARAAYVARRAGIFGVRTGQVTVDMAAVRQRKRDMVDSFRQGTLRRIQRAENADLIRGEARFVGHKELEVRLEGGARQRLAADVVVIDAGSRPRQPDLPGLAEVPYLDSTSIMELGEVPAQLLILGGGYVAVEFAQMFQRFGSQVTVVQRSGQLLSNEDADIAAAVADVLREEGVEILLDAEARRVIQEDDSLHLEVETAGRRQILRGSHLLVATGRVPNTEALNLAAGGVAIDTRGYIPVDDGLQTNVPGVYAVGDINGGPVFTHISYDDYRILRDALLGSGERTTGDRLLPYTIFIDPQLGRVGLTERQARDQGNNVRVARLPMSSVARALEVEETRGVIKAVVDADSQEILGAAVLGYQGGEIMAILEVAMLGHLPYTTLRDAVLTHPTMAEALNNLFASFEDEGGPA